jgi:hypothetical protein
MSTPPKHASICHECLEVAIPTIVIRGPKAYESTASERKFCCVACFWQWIERVISDRDKGGRLDRQTNWE